MRVLVTGGGGFIGRHLVKKLLGVGGFEVTVLDNGSNCPEDWAVRGAHPVRADVRDYVAVRNAVKNHGLVIHLAAKTSVSESEKDGGETDEVNVGGSLNVAKACVENGVSGLIAMSSAAVYGEGSRDVPAGEGAPTRPISAYGRSKLGMEGAVREFSDRHGLDSIIFRPFNVYGRGQSGACAGVIKRFSESARDKKPARILGDGTQTRDFVHVDDVVGAVAAAIPRLAGENASVYNIGSGRSITVNGLAGMVFSIFKSELRVSFHDAPRHDIRFSRADIAKLEKKLRYSPRRGLREGIAGTFAEADRAVPGSS